MSILHFLRTLCVRALLELDLFGWRVKTAPIANSHRPSNDSVILICDLWTMISVAKIQAIFAASLSIRGCSPVVLLRKRNKLICGIYSALCANFRFVFLDDYVTPSLLSESFIQARDYINSYPCLDEFIGFEINGFRIGRNVLSRAVRAFRVGRLDPSNPKHMALLIDTLAESLVAMHVSEGILLSLSPDKALFLEKGYTPAAEIFDACVLNNIDTIQWFSAPQDDHLIFKRFSTATRSHHPFSLGDSSWSRILQLPWSNVYENHVLDKIFSHYDGLSWYNRQQLQIGKSCFTPTQTRALLGSSSDRKIAVIFAHVLYDATFFYGSNLFADYEQWLIESVRLAICNTSIDWFIKVHPSNAWRSRMDGSKMEHLESNLLLREFGDLPPHISIIPADTPINTYSFFNAIDYALTVRGTVGIEFPCFGVPVVTAGDGRYSKKGFTIDPPTVDAYQNVLLNLHNIPPLSTDQITLARKYAYGSFFLRPIPLKSFSIKNSHNRFVVSELKQSVVFDSPPTSSLVFNADLSEITRFILESNDDDLLASL
jgi:hypothetical protein